MLKHIIKAELIALRKNLTHSLTNILGLTLGITAVFLIFIFVRSETSYDKHFAESEDIFRIGVEYTFDDKVDLFANIARPVGKTMQDEFAEIEAQTRVLGVNGLFTHSGLLAVGENLIKSDQIFYTDSTYFDVFDQEFLEGTAATALTQPNSIVISSSLALRLFNQTSAMGQIIRLDDQVDVQVTGVIKSSKALTHLPIEAWVSWHNGARPGENGRWLGWHTYTYIKLRSDANAENFESKIPAYYDKYMKAPFEQFGGTARILMQPVTDIHLNSDLQWEAYPNGSLSNVYIFATVGILIIFLVSINYTNLATAKSIQRIREVGIRKVLGSNRQSIIMHTAVNSLLVAVVSALFSVAFIYLLLPFFNQMSGIQIDTTTVLEFWNVVFFISLFLIISLVSAVYPALSALALRPTEVLNNRSSGSARRSVIRRVFVGLQFIIAAGLLFSTSVVLKQSNFIANRDLGFDKESAMVVSINDTSVQKRIEFIKSEWLKNPAITAISSSEEVPTEPLVQVLADIKELDGSYNTTGAEYMSVDYDFLQTLGVKLASGRFFDEQFGNDADTKILVNETAAKLFGGTAAAIGRKLAVSTDDDGNPIDLEIIGVVTDFHTISLHSLIQPIIFVVTESPKKLLVKLQSDNLQTGVDFVKKEWDSFNSSFPLEYSFLDDGFKNLHKTEANLQQLLLYFCVLIIIISCLGLLGLVSYASKSRVREVTIRKVMGSSNQGIFNLLIKSYLIPVLLALIVAIPLGWFLMENWLNNFSYRTDIDAFRAVWVVLITIAIAFATVSFHTRRVSRLNPVKTLRHE